MNLFIDAAERIFWTFLAGFLGALLASPVFDDLGLNWEDALKLGLFTGAMSAAKVLLAISIDKSSGGQLTPGEATVEVKPDTP